MIKVQDKISILPNKPGVYLFKDKQGSVIYIGKAKNLRKRAASYFIKKHDNEKTKRMVGKIDDLDYFVTDNEVEAFLLESRLIKEHRPIYNIQLKDSKRYAYLKMTKEAYPRLIISRDETQKDGYYFGPFTDAKTRDTLIYYVHILFKIRNCGAKLPKRACLQYHIDRCSAPCIKKISRMDYLKNIKYAKQFLKGNYAGLKKNLKAEMGKYSKQMEFEKAREIKDKLRHLAKAQEIQKQKVDLIKSYNEDVINYIVQNNQMFIEIFQIEKGVVKNKKEFKLNMQVASRPMIYFQNFIRQYYYDKIVPDALVIPDKMPDQQIMAEYLSRLKDKKVKIIVPQKGYQLKLLNLVKKNLQQLLIKENPILAELQKKLNLSKTPYIMEAFDVSNIGQNQIVGSMVQFQGVEPKKSQYRRFKIKTIVKQDDFAAMAELISRRYYRLIKENKKLPDLIIIDGGKGQLSAAFQVLQEYNLNIPIIALAKKQEEIFIPNQSNPIKLSHQLASLKLLQKIRNEAHRFAVNYHRLLRTKKLLK